ncbi:MAG: cell division ATP-binding protein FtsE, partial [Steroidobacteraceae bacterium]
MIVFEAVHKRYPGGREALTDVSFELDRGEMAFLTGHSGAGKSTILKLVALLERPSRGRVVVNGTDVSTVRSRGVPAFRRQVGMVFQDHKLLSDRPVFDNVALPLAISGIARRDLDKRVRAEVGRASG